MTRDPFVEEIHQARQKLLDECGGDLDRLMDRFKAAEAQHADRLVTPETVRKISQARARTKAICTRQGTKSSGE